MPMLQPYLPGAGHRADPQHLVSLAWQSDWHFASAVSKLEKAAQAAADDLETARSAVGKLITSARIALPPERIPSAHAVSSADADTLREITATVYDEVKRISPSVVAGGTRLDHSARLDTIAAAAEQLDDAVRAASQTLELTFVLPSASVSVPSQMTATDLSARRSHGFVVGDHARTTLVHRCRIEQPVVEIADLIRASTSGAAASVGAHATEVNHHGVLMHHRIFVAQDAALAFRESSVTRGDGSRNQLDVLGTIRRCPVRLEQLLAHPEVLKAVKAVKALADAPESPQSAAAQADLTAAIHAAAAAIAPADLIDCFHDLVIKSYPGTVSGRFGSVTMAHLVGGAVGRKNTTTLVERYSMNKMLIR